MRKINEVIIHCSATRPNWMQDMGGLGKVAEIRRWHVEDRNWSDIGYHYVIDRSGKVFDGRPEARVGAHVKGRNSNSIGICLIGGFGGSAGDIFDNHFTEEQEAALRKLIGQLQRRHTDITKISGHNQYSPKACPCFSVPAWLKEAPAPKMKPSVDADKPRALAQSKTVQASVVQGASAVGGAVAAFQALNGTAQIIAMAGCVVIALLAMYILKERLKAWAAGWR